MEPTWNSPDSWEKDGSIISSVSSVKKSAWTTILKATETHNGKATEVVIKQFAVPEDVVDNPDRITLERAKFLTAARLQWSLTQDGPNGGAKAWVKILRLDEQGKNPSFSMEKCGPSIQDLLDNKVQMCAKDLYFLNLAFLQALIELQDRAKRSHGNIKPSDVLCALPGQSPPYKLADPLAKGEDHFANDLYSLGSILFHLIEGREWDPLNPITPTKGWQRFKGKRDRWMQFCNMLLNPNGCHETLSDVKKEAKRLKPGSPARVVMAVLGTLILAGAGAVGYHFLMTNVLSKPSIPVVSTQGGNEGNSNATTAAVVIATRIANTQGSVIVVTTQGGTQIIPGTLDPAIRAAYDDARRQFRDASTKWNALQPTPRYDHNQSNALARQARALVIDPATLTTAAGYKDATDAYKNALAKMNQALDAQTAEEQAGQKQDAAAFAGLQKAIADYNSAKSQWDETAAKFPANQNHIRSIAMAQAALLPDRPASTDPTLAPSTADMYRNATAHLLDALKLVPDETRGAGGVAGAGGGGGDEITAAKSALSDAQIKFAKLQTDWNAVDQSNDTDLSAARALADEARKMLPQQVMLTDAQSYRTTAATFQSAADKMAAALEAAARQRALSTQKSGDVSAAVAAANQALAAKDYSAALNWYRKAADMGNASAMHNVGLLYENGQGTSKNETEAANWYRKAADLGNAAAMYDLGVLYETGRGVEKDAGRAAQFFRRAAEGKIVAAMDRLGVCYENGWGVQEDPAEAMKFYRQAADANDPSGINHVGVLYDKGIGVKADAAEAMKWYRKAADLGSAAAMNNVGGLYNDGRGVKPDFAEAMKWYKKAADLKFAPALCNIGVLYDNGNGVPINHAEALKWFKQGAELKDGQSMYNLGFMYETGRGVQPDIVESVNWYRKAFRSEDEDAKQLAADALDRLKYAH